MTDIDGVKVKIEGDASSLKSALNESKIALQGLGIDTGKLSSLLGAAGLGAAVAVAGKALVDLGRKAMECQKEFIQAEAQQIRFNAAVAASSKITTQGRKILEDLAGAYAKLSGEDDDAILGMEAMLVATGRTTEEIQKMLPAALGLATATGVDLNTALDQLNKTFSGTAERLAQTTPELKDLTEEELKNGRAVDVMLEKYGELSTALSTSGKVSVQNYKTAIGNLKEEMGRSVESSLRPFRNAVTEIAEAWAEAIRKQNEYKDVLAKDASGEGLTDNEKLTLAKGQLEEYVATRTSLLSQGIPKNANIIKYYDDEINKLTESINKMKAAQVGVNRALAGKAEGDAGLAAAEAKEKASAKAAQERQDEFVKIRQGYVDSYDASIASIQTLRNADLITEDQANDRRLASAMKFLNDLADLRAKYPDQWGKYSIAAWEKGENDAKKYKTAVDAANNSEKDAAEILKEKKKNQEDLDEWLESQTRKKEDARRAEVAAITEYYDAEDEAATRSMENSRRDEAERISNTVRANTLLNRLMLIDYEAYIAEKLKLDQGYDAASLDALEKTVGVAEQYYGQELQVAATIYSKQTSAYEKGVQDRETQRRAESAAIFAEYVARQDADLESATRAREENRRAEAADIAERMALDKEFNERRDQERADEAAAASEEETQRRVEAAQRFKDAYLAMESGLTDAINNERDARRKALLSSLLEEVKAARAAGVSQEETRKKVAETISKYDISKEIKDQYAQIITASQWSTQKQIEYLEGLKLLVSSTSKEFQMLNEMIAKLKDNDAIAQADKEFQKFSGTFGLITSTLGSAFSSLDSYIRAVSEATTKEIQKQLEIINKSFADSASQMQIMYDALEEMGATQQAADLKATKTKAEALNEYSKLELDQLNSLYATAIQLGQKETAQTLQEAITRVQAKEAAENEIKKIEYDAALQSWNLQVLSAAAQAAQATLNAYSSTAAIPIVGPGLAPVAAAAAAGIGIVQIAAVQAAKPVLDTGGIVRAREDTSVTVGRGTGEVMFGTSALGDPMMKGFADMIAARINSQPVVVQLALDGKVIAESTVRRINDGQVRLKR